MRQPNKLTTRLTLERDAELTGSMTPKKTVKLSLEDVRPGDWAVSGDKRFEILAPANVKTRPHWGISVKDGLGHWQFVALDILEALGYHFERDDEPKEKVLHEWTSGGVDYRIVDLDGYIKCEWRSEGKWWIDSSVALPLKREIIRLAASQNRWIPVEERLPDTLADYKVIFSDGTVGTRTYCPKRGWEPNKILVTHWLPIPPLPEEK